MNKNFYKRFLGLSYELENSIILESIKRGFLMTLPALFIGAIALVIISFPIQGFQDWIQSLGGGAVYQFFDVIYQITYGFLSIYLTIGISYNCAKRLIGTHIFSQNICVLVSVMCLVESLGVGSDKFTYQLVRDIMQNKRSETIVKSIIQLGKELHFKVIAEYVDEEAKRDLLIKLGCE